MEIERLKGERNAAFVREGELMGESDNERDRATAAEQALPAELEGLAANWEGRATRLEGQRGSRADTPVQIANRSGAEFAFREVASHLRERAAELREGAA